MTAGASAETAKNTYNDLYRVLGDTGQATEAAQHLAKLTTEEKSLSEWTNICQGVYATFGESIPIESLAEGAAEASRTGTMTAGLTDALVWAGVAEDEFNAKLQACTTQQEREALIRSTLNGIYSEAAANYEVNNGAVLAQNDAQRKLSDAMAKLGEVVAPVNTMLTELGAEILTQLMPYIQGFAENYLPKIKDVLNALVGILTKTLDFINKHKTVLSVLAGIILGIAAAITAYNTVQAVKNALDITGTLTVKKLTTALAAKAVALWATIAPYAAVVAAIAAVIAIIVVCVKNWDTIKAAVKNAASAIWSAISSTFGKVKDTVSNAMNGAIEKVRSAIDRLKSLFKFDWSLPKPKLPSFSISGGKAPWGFMGQGSLPRISINWNALGGVFDSATILPYGDSLQGLGEAGTEAIVPLEKNTQWLDRIAERLAAKGGSKVVLQVDKKVLGEITVDGINTLTRQRGEIPLNII